jgi:hypothetical protein
MGEPRSSHQIQSSPAVSAGAAADKRRGPLHL